MDPEYVGYVCPFCKDKLKPFGKKGLGYLKCKKCDCENDTLYVEKREKEV